MVDYYPIIPHKNGLETLINMLIKSEDLKLPVKITVKMAEFFSRITYFPFKFGRRIKLQVSGRATGTKFAPAYA